MGPTHLASAESLLAWIAAYQTSSEATREAMLAAVVPFGWVTAREHPWRVCRTARGIEIRPELTSPFLRFGDLPRITALGIGKQIEVELTTRSARWVDRFEVDSFDVAAMAEVMLAERELPHDNLPLLFPPGSRPIGRGGE